MAEHLSKDSIVPIAEALAAQKLGICLPANDAIKKAGALLEFEANNFPITDTIIPIDEPLDQNSIVTKAKELVQESAGPIINALAEKSIVPIADALAEKLGLKLPGNVKEAGALLAFNAFKSAIEVLSPALAGTMTFNVTAFTLAIIQQKLNDISDKLDILLEKDSKTAFSFWSNAMISLKHHKYEHAFKDFNTVLYKATEAYNCAKNEDLKLIQSTRMKMFCLIATKSYNEDLKHFIPYDSLPEEDQNWIAELVRAQIEMLLKDLTTVKPRSDAKKFIKTITRQQKRTDEIMKQLDDCLKSAIFFVQSLDWDPWKAKTGVLTAMQKYNKAMVLECVAGTIFSKSVDFNTIKHIVMIESDFDFNQKGGPDRGTALYYASKFGNEDVVDALLKKNADHTICAEHAHANGNSPLMMSSQQGHVKIVTKLLLQENPGINKRGQGGWTALFFACCYGKEDVIDVLLEADADPNICSSVSGWSPLMTASQGGYSQIVQKLLLRNADISKTSKYGVTALSIAGDNKHVEVVAILENFITEKHQSTGNQ